MPDIDLQTRLDNLDFDMDSGSYIVRPGETLETVAFRYNMSVENLKLLNPGLGDAVFPGMDLNVRQQPAAVAARVTPSDTRNATPKADVVRVAPVTSSQVTLVDESSLAGWNDTDQVSIQRVAPGSGPAQIRSQPNYPEIVRSAPAVIASKSAFTAQEEVINDDNFQLPDSKNRLQAQPSQWIGEWSWPIDGQLARDYDPGRTNGGGIEIVGAPGQNIYATREGVVNWVGGSPGGSGKMVIVRHSDGYMSIYSNAEELFVAMGEIVEKGQAIAKLGANANDEPLLRFEISKNGNLLNPNEFLTPR